MLPKQHQGALLRIGNAAGASFDRTFMDYQISEQTRLRQLTVEIFVHEGLDDAINLDRESYNFAHPHYQFLVKWLHSAIRQFTNQHKKVGKLLREKNRIASEATVRKSITSSVAKKLADVGVDDLVEVEFIEKSLLESVEEKRDEGIIAFDQESIFIAQGNSGKSGRLKQTDITVQKAEALTQLLYGWGLLDELSYDEQARLVRDILEIVLMGEGK